MANQDIMELVVGYTQDGAKLINRLHVRATQNDITMSTPQAAAEGFVEDIWPKFKAVMSINCVLQTVRARRIYPTVGGSWITNVDEAGAVSDDPLPPNAALIISIRTALRTRRGRGRIFLPGIPDSYHNHGNIDISNFADYNNLTQALGLPIQKGGEVVFEYGIWDKIGNNFNTFLSAVIRARIATLRSRRMSNP